MKIGYIYKYKNGKTLLIPLSEKSLDGIVFCMRIFPADDNYDMGQVVFETNSSVTNTQKANQYFTYGRLDFLGVRVNDEVIKSLHSTYIPSNIKELATGDRFIESGKPEEYTVLGFFERSVKVDVSNVNSAFADRVFPYAVNLEPLIDYVQLAINSRDGIEKLIVTDDAGLPVQNEANKALTALFYANTKLAYWSPDAPRVSSVVYLKQKEAPLLKDFTVSFNPSRKPLSNEEYAEYRAMLGEEYSDDFFDLIDQLDWAKISELKKSIPEVLAVIKDILKEVYVEFLIEKRLNPPAVVVPQPVVTPPPTVGVPLKTFKWLDDDWIRIDEVAYNAFQKAYGANESGKILIRSLEAVVPVSEGSTKMELRKFMAVALDEIGYGSAKLIELRNGLINIENMAAAEYMKINYPAYFEGWDFSISTANRFLFDYDKFLDVAVLLAAPTVKSTPAVVPPPSQDFKWITAPWEDLLTEDEMKSLVGAGLWYEGGFAKYASFECVYKNEGRKSFAMYSFGHAYLGGSYNALTEALYKYMVANIDRDYVWDTYPQVLDAMATAIRGSSVSANFVDTFIIAFDDVGLFKDLLDAAVPILKLTQTTMSQEVLYINNSKVEPSWFSPMSSMLQKRDPERLRDILVNKNYLSLNMADAEYLFTYIYRCGFIDSQNTYFRQAETIVPFQAMGSSKMLCRADAYSFLSRTAFGRYLTELSFGGWYEVGMSRRWIVKECYPYLEESITRAKKAGMTMDDIADDILDAYGKMFGSTPAPQKPTAKKKPAKKAEPKPVAEELDDLSNLDFDDI